MAKKPELTIVFTVYNGVKTIEKVVRDYYTEISKKVPCEIIIAEDGSTDGTKEVLYKLEKEYPIRLVLGDKKKGFQQASIDALREVKTPLAFFADADMQYSEKDFWKLWRQKDYYDLVIGRKLIRRDPFHRNFLAWGFNLMVRNIFNLLLFDIDSGYRLIKKEVLDAILKDVKYLKYGFTAEFTIRAYYKGYTMIEIPITHRPRKEGTTGMFPMSRLPKIVLMQTRDLLKLRSEMMKRGKNK